MCTLGQSETETHTFARRVKGRLERVGTPHFDFKFPEYSIVPSGKGNDITILLTISFAPGGVEDKDVSPSGGTSRSNTKQ